MGKGFFPLDEQLGLDGAGLTPRGQEALVRLATWMSFEHACELLKDLLGIEVREWAEVKTLVLAEIVQHEEG